MLWPDVTSQLCQDSSGYTAVTVKISIREFKSLRDEGIVYANVSKRHMYHSNSPHYEG